MDKDIGARSRAAGALGRIGPAAKDAVPALIEALKAKKDPKYFFVVRASAAFALGEIRPATKGTVRALAEALKDAGSSVGSKVTAALGKIGPNAKEAVPALIARLDGGKSKSRSVRLESISALSKIGPVAIPALLEASKNGTTVSIFGDSAIPVLARMGVSAVSGLKKALKHKSEKVRLTAAASLGQIGPDAKDAVPPLKLMSENDPDASVRRVAAMALKSIAK